MSIFFIIDRLSHSYCYDSLSLYKDIPHTYLMKILRRLTPVFAYTWSRDSISAAEKVRGEGVFKYPLLNRHLVYFHRTPKIKCNASRTYSLRGRNVDSHVTFLSNTMRDSHPIFSLSAGFYQNIISKGLGIFCLSWASAVSELLRWR